MPKVLAVSPKAWAIFLGIFGFLFRRQKIWFGQQFFEQKFLLLAKILQCLPGLGQFFLEFLDSLAQRTSEKPVFQKVPSPRCQGGKKKTQGCPHLRTAGLLVTLFFRKGGRKKNKVPTPQNSQSSIEPWRPQGGK